MGGGGGTTWELGVGGQGVKVSPPMGRSRPTSSRWGQGREGSPPPSPHFLTTLTVSPGLSFCSVGSEKRGALNFLVVCGFIMKSNNGMFAVCWMNGIQILLFDVCSQFFWSTISWLLSWKSCHFKLQFHDIWGVKAKLKTLILKSSTDLKYRLSSQPSPWPLYSLLSYFGYFHRNVLHNISYSYLTFAS